MINEAQRAARRKGGYATLLKYGREHYRRMGRRGGRPASFDALEIRALRALKCEFQTKEVRQTNCDNKKEEAKK